MNLINKPRQPKNPMPPKNPIAPLGASFDTMPSAYNPTNGVESETLNDIYAAQAAAIIQPEDRYLGPARDISLKRLALAAILTILLTAGAFGFLLTRHSNKTHITNNSQVPSQIAQFPNKPLPNQALKLDNNTVIVNGDIFAYGTVRFYSGTNYFNLSANNLTANRTYQLPNASGTLCLDSNNCGYATETQLNQVAARIGQSRGGQSIFNTINEIGVSSLNGLAGDLTLQGTANQISVGASLGTVSLSLPQDINTSSSPTFAGLTLTGTATQNGFTICDSSNNCGFGGSGGDLSHLGNSFGVPITVGTLDNFGLNLKTNNVTVASLSNSGQATFQNASNSATAFRILDASSSSLFTVNTSAGTVTIVGLSGSGANLTSLNASNFSSGTLNDLRLSANVALLNGTGPQTFSGNDKFTGTLLSANASNSTAAFQVQNAAGNELLTADTTGSQVVLGKTSTVDGKLLFKSASGTGSVAISPVNPGAANFTINLPAASGTLCLTSGNCAGVGGQVGGTGTTNTLTMFTGASNIGDSILSQSGTVLTAAGDLNLTSGHQFQINGSQISSANLSNDSNLAKLSANQTFAGNNTFSSASNSFTGSGSGLTSLNATNISSGTLNDLRLSANVTLQGNVFNGVSQLVQLNGSGFLPALNGSLLTSLNATNISSGTLSDTRLSANVALLNGTGPQTFSGNNKFTGTVLAQNTSDSTAAFQIQNAAGNNYLLVNTSGASVSLGDAGIASTIQVGNTTGAVAQSINVGTNATASATNTIHIGDAATATNAITIGSASNSASTITIEAGTAASSIAIGNGATAHQISIGAGSGANNTVVHIGDGVTGGSNTAVVTIGSNNAAASTTTIQGGNGATAININTATSGTLNIGNGAVANTIQLGNTTGAVAQTINIGNNATASSSNSVAIGNLLGTSSTVVQGGTGATAVQLIQGSGGTITIGATVGASAVSVQCGTGNCGIGNNATDHSTTLGSATGTSVTTVQSGTGNVILQPAGSGATASVQIGAANGGGGSTTPDLLVLDGKSTTGDPAEIDGAMYFNVALGSFRCGYGTNWSNCAINSIDHSYNFEDDFVGGQVSAATANTVYNVGSLGWTVESNVSCGLLYNGTDALASHDNPGSLRLIAGGANGDGCAMGEGAGSSGNNGTIAYNDILAAGDVLKMNVALNSVTVGIARYGFINNTSKDYTNPTSGIWWEFDHGADATHWRYCYASNNNATATCAASTATLSADKYYHLEIRVISSSAVTFLLVPSGGGTPETHALTGITVDLGATNNLSPMFTNYATSAATFASIIDYIQWSGVITTAAGR